jgi:AcrR family transcriptional regulator
MSEAERTRADSQAIKRERVLTAARDLFYARGYTSTTLDDVAAALGVTKPFIYTYFRGKAELLAALCTPTIALSLDAIANAAGGPGTPTERLRRAMVDFTKVVLSRQANIAIFFREEKNLAPEALAEITALRKRFDHSLSALLAEGVAAGAFTVPDVSLAALALGGMVSWAYTWHRPDGRLPLDALCERFAELALRLVGAAGV